MKAHNFSKVSFLRRTLNALRRTLYDGRPTDFKVMFARFRQVLENHNKAIEIIADMGDKLGGDYIFDVTYIRNAYDGLFETLAASLASFDVLTQNKYPGLGNVFGHIDREIRLLVPALGDEGRAGLSSARRDVEYLLSYDKITLGMAEEVGGKNANLAELKNNLDVEIPDAFAITASAYDEFIRHNNILTHTGDFGRIYDSIMQGKMPPALENTLDKAIAMLRSKYGGKGFLAVRSSAEVEDGEFSFAGQFDTILNVPLESKAVQEAYKRVIASLFSARAAAYRRQSGIDVGSIRMAVACVLMVDAAVSGVAYSTNPNGDGGTMIINSSWGLGVSVVEGRTDADFYLIKKGAVPEIAAKRTGKKDSMVVSRDKGGIAAINTPDAIAEKNSLTEDQALALARQAMQIEDYFRQPQDIEWAIDGSGKIFILQARPLRLQALRGSERSSLENEMSGAKILMKVRGDVVLQGSGAGRVFIFKHSDQLESFSRGDVLVARNDSSDFIRVMPYASAIITDTGSLTSHMASLCREFKVPAFVNAGSATRILQHGRQITVTVDDEDTLTAYDGILCGVLESSRSGTAAMEDIYEFRKKRYILRYISPLNLVDPLMEKFTPERCKTMHDVLRFIHEKSVMELIDNAMAGLRGQAAVKLDLPIPAGIIAVDIGGGLDRSVNKAAPSRGDSVTFEQITSVPLRAVLGGMMHPGAWHSDPVALKAGDFLTSMVRMPDIRSGSFATSNVAVISREYLNLSLRFGYHFNMIDCYCSETARNNHIYFRFTGGATDMVKRSRRVELLSVVLREYGFNTQSKGDLIVGRLANMTRADLEKILDGIGRLIAFTRQLDAVLHDDSKVQRYARNFLEGNYEL